MDDLIENINLCFDRDGECDKVRLESELQDFQKKSNAEFLKRILPEESVDRTDICDCGAEVEFREKLFKKRGFKKYSDAWDEGYKMAIEDCINYTKDKRIIKYVKKFLWKKI